MKTTPRSKTAAIPAELSSEQKTPAAGLLPLNLLTGRWRLRGGNLKGALNPGTSVTGEVLYEWLPGEFFMSAKWDRRFENDKYQGIGIIGFDEYEHSLYINNYDNLGFNRRYTLCFDVTGFTFTGENERAHLRFSNDYRSYTEYWEVLNEQQEWIPLCYLEATKLSGAEAKECHSYVRLSLGRGG